MEVLSNYYVFEERICRLWKSQRLFLFSVTLNLNATFHVHNSVSSYTGTEIHANWDVAYDLFRSLIILFQATVIHSLTQYSKIIKYMS